eukprot:PhF_6_TR16853/c0_g1_i1/m.25392
MPTNNIGFKHITSNCEILELEGVDSDTTLRELRYFVQERMATDMQLPMGLGIEDCCEFGIEGAPMVDTIEGMAIGPPNPYLRLQAIDTNAYANMMLHKYPSMPMKALWEALNDKGLVGLPLALIR